MLSDHIYTSPAHIEVRPFTRLSLELDKLRLKELMRTLNTLEDYLPSEEDLTRCSYKLLESPIFAAQSDYVRRQFVYSLLQVEPPVAVPPRNSLSSLTTDGDRKMARIPCT